MWCKFCAEVVTICQVHVILQGGSGFNVVDHKGKPARNGHIEGVVHAECAHTVTPPKAAQPDLTWRLSLVLKIKLPQELS